MDRRQLQVVLGLALNLHRIATRLELDGEGACDMHHAARDERRAYPAVHGLHRPAGQLHITLVLGKMVGKEKGVDFLSRTDRFGAIASCVSSPWAETSPPTLRRYPQQQAPPWC